MLYRVHLAWVGFELTTLVVIGTDCILGSYIPNYHTIENFSTIHCLKLLVKQSWCAFFNIALCSVRGRPCNFWGGSYDTSPPFPTRFFHCEGKLKLRSPNTRSCPLIEAVTKAGLIVDISLWKTGNYRHLLWKMQGQITYNLWLLSCQDIVWYNIWWQIHRRSWHGIIIHGVI
jgi:hypothetical protein